MQLVIIALSIIILAFLWYCYKCKSSNKPVDLIIIMLFIIGITILVPFLINESYKLNAGYVTLWTPADALSFYGSYLTFIGALSLSVILYKRERDKEYVKSTSDGLKLHDDITRLLFRLSDMSKDYPLKLLHYNHQWMDLLDSFFNIDLRYKSDYRREITQFYDMVLEVSLLIQQNDHESAYLAYKSYRRKQEYLLHEIDIIQTNSIIGLIAGGTPQGNVEFIPWERDIGVCKKHHHLADQYRGLIENWISRKLELSSDKSLELSEIQEELIEYLLENTDVRGHAVNEHGLVQKGRILDIIIKASLRLKKIHFGWNTYNLL